MRANRAEVLHWINLSEGGYVNHRDDPGGPTDRGITQATFDAWNTAHGRPLRPVRGISQAEADEILGAPDLDSVRFDDLPSGVDYAVADYAVNSGPGRAAKVLQRILGVPDDGVIGAVTLAALAQKDPEQIVLAICSERMRFLRRLPTWRTFGRGWTMRVMGANDGPQLDDIGVIDRAVRLALGWPGIPGPVAAGPGRAPEPEPGPRSIALDPALLAGAAPIVGGVATMSQGDGPMQWAIAAVCVIAALGVVAWLILRAKRVER
jgi:lysozyme family protein